MQGNLIELQRCRDAASVAELTGILDLAGILHRIGSDAPVFDISTVGSGNEAQVIVSVRAEDYDAARTAMEQDCLRIPLPEDHYLVTSSDDELVEIIAHPGEWSAFDVAHARTLMKERGIDPSVVAAKKEERLNQLKIGKPAPPSLLGFGWLAAIMGGWIGVAIAWSLCNSMDKTPDGEFFTYDGRSRAIGKMMFPVASFTSGLTILGWLYFHFG